MRSPVLRWPAAVPSDRPGRSGRSATWFCVLAALCLLGPGLWIVTRVDYQLSGAVLVAPVLLLISLPLIERAKSTEADPWVRRLFVLALLAILLAALGRYWFSFDYSGGRVDAAKYSRAAADIADQFHAGILLPDLHSDLVGSGFIVLLTGAMFAIIGPSILGAFLIWAWIGYWGLYFCYRAFLVGLPHGDRRRYAVLIFFLPSMLFWTAAVGKEAWMMFSIGLSLWGAAKLLSHQRGAIALLIAGVAATALVRPHIAILLYGAMFISLLLRRSLATDRLGPIAKFVLILLLVPGGFVLLNQAGSFLGVETFTPDSVGSLLDDQAEATSDIGSSTFDAVRATGPSTGVRAAVTVLFRPFPWEATNLQFVLSSLEGAVLLGLMAVSMRRMRRLPYLLRDHAFVLLALIYLIGFVVAFSALGNFGLLVRERIMLLPLFLVLLALPRGRGNSEEEPGAVAMSATRSQIRSAAPGSR